MEYPSYEELKKITNNIHNICEQGDGFIKNYFGEKDENDKTLVFDYINDNWFNYIFENIKKIADNSYLTDQTIEYKISYICVEINLLHKLTNAKKDLVY